MKADKELEMSLGDELHRIDFERARADPASVFTSPDAVLADERFADPEKIEILRQWAYDADQLAIAECEGMAGGEPAMLGRVLAALHEMQEQVQKHGAPPTDSPGSAEGSGRVR